MSRQGMIHRAGGWTAGRALWLCLAVASATFAGPARLWAQGPAPVAPPGPVAVSPGMVVVEGGSGTAVGAPVLPPEIQVVRFHGPEGVKVEVLGPNPVPVSAGDGHGLATIGLQVGVGYRLRLSNLPVRPGAELFPVIEVVGHLHRPDGIDA